MGRRKKLRLYEPTAKAATSLRVSGETVSLLDDCVHLVRTCQYLDRLDTALAPAGRVTREAVLNMALLALMEVTEELIDLEERSR